MAQATGCRLPIACFFGRVQRDEWNGIKSEGQKGLFETESSYFEKGHHLSKRIIILIYWNENTRFLRKKIKTEHKFLHPNGTFCCQNETVFFRNGTKLWTETEHNHESKRKMLFNLSKRKYTILRKIQNGTYVFIQTIPFVVETKHIFLSRRNKVVNRNGI